MKKIALFSLICCLGMMNCFAGGLWDIKSKELSRTPINKNSNEYFFVNNNDYFECDDDEGDVNDHVFAIVVRSRTGGLDYTAKECALEVGDRWRDRNIPWCDASDKCKAKVNFGSFEFCTKATHRGLIKNTLFVDGGKKTKGDSSTIKRYVGCFLCKDGYERNGDKCVATHKKGGNETPTPTKPNPKPQPDKTCEQLYKGNQAAIDCCNAKDADWEKGRCECKDKGKEWNAEKKQCIAKETHDNPVVECTYEFNGSIECNGKVVYVNKTMTLKPEDCLKIDSITDDDIKGIKEYRDELCKNVPVSTTPTGPSEDEIAKATARLKSFTDSAKGDASVWRDAEGNFNKARLASDLTAGVVLGTVGGVVSGVVIKKKQVEKGFEALHCTVGGQKIAGWGDEFSVGLQR